LGATVTVVAVAAATAVVAATSEEEFIIMREPARERQRTHTHTHTHTGIHQGRRQTQGIGNMCKRNAEGNRHDKGKARADLASAESRHHLHHCA